MHPPGNGAGTGHIRRADRPQVVATGLGAVTAIGADREGFWEGLTAGRSGIRDLTLFDPAGYRTRNAAWIDEDQLDLSFLSPAERRSSSRADRLGLLAAREAVADSGLDLSRLPPERLAVVLGAGAAGLLEAESWFERLVRTGRRGSPRAIVHHFPDSVTDRIATHFGAQGIRSTVVTACSSSAGAIGQAADLLRAGLADVAITGGSDVLARLTYGGFNALRVVDPDPCRPFDRERKGLTLGEGAGILVLEREDDARRRGAAIYCRLAGYGLTSDAYHMTAPEPSGRAGARAIRAALDDARLDPGDVDYINAHGTATPHNDSAEAAAIHRVFGERARRLPTSSIKAMIGHCLCSAGSMEAVATALTVSRGVLPPTVRYANPDPECDLDVVPNTAREGRVRVALSNSFAFGGNSVCLVFQALED
jgi:3-oxoacyl-[acyl-carrier-protein] synthase II